MKLTAAILISLGSFLVATPVLADGDKVTICHAAGQEGTTHYNTLTISENAVYKDQGGHFYENGTPRAGHEQDYFGPCLTDETTTTEVVDTTSTTTATESSTSTTSDAPTTSAVESTTTSFPTSTSLISSPVSSVSPSPSTEPTPVFPAPSTGPTVPGTQTAITIETKKLPETGDNTGQLALIALGLTLIGGGATVAARRK